MLKPKRENLHKKSQLDGGWAKRIQYTSHMVNSLPESFQSGLHKSWKTFFNNNVYSGLGDVDMSRLIEKYTRSGIPSLVYVSLKLLKAFLKCTDEELIAFYNYDLRVCYSVGLRDLENHMLESIMVDKEMKILDSADPSIENEENDDMLHQMILDGIKGLDFQGSVPNINFSIFYSQMKKLFLLETYITILQGFYNDLPDKDRNRFESRVRQYIGSDASLIISKLEFSELDLHLNRILALLFYFETLYRNHDNINQMKNYQIAKKVLNDRFHISVESE